MLFNNKQIKSLSEDYLKNQVYNLNGQNLTFYILKSNSTCSNKTNLINDDYEAAKYIVIVIMVYAFAIIFFIASQIRSKKKISDEVEEVNATRFIRSMRNGEVFTREVLGLFDCYMNFIAH
jgi:hypothetical protein